MLKPRASPKRDPVGRTPDALSDSCPGPLRAEDHAVSRHLLARAQAGDATALDDLLRRYQDRVQRIVRIRLGPDLRRSVETTDLVQETFQAALRSIGELRVENDADLLNWLARIATNRIRDEHDRLNAQKRGSGRDRALDGDDSRARAREPVADDTSPVEAAMRSEVREVLDRAIAELPEEYREMVLLRDYCGASWESIAERFPEKSVHAAQQLHQRAWIKVRRLAEPRLRDRA